MNFKFAENLIHRFSVFFRVRFIEFIDRFERLFDLRFHILGEIAVDHTVERSHTYTEELIEVVGINAEERETFEQWNKFLLGFLQNAVVEVHPAHVAFYVCFFNNFFFGHDLLNRYKIL